jgi:dTDP-4-dehydrorhamnose 3,5-epimerase
VELPILTFIEAKLQGAFIIQAERFEDERGFFALTWSQDDFERRGLNSSLLECHISFNQTKGTLRGMHYQTAPYAQAKLVRCTMGAIYDCIIDLRMDSPTFKQWYAIELTERNRTMLYVPEGFAHGFQTLEHETEVFYQMSGIYEPEYGRGVRWNDPAFGIEWPLPVEVIAARDGTCDDFK